MFRLCFLVAAIFLAGCNTQANFAPVVELNWQPQNSQQSTHIVRRGETLYAIAFRYERDYRQLAQINHLNRPYSLRVGQVLRVRGNADTHFPKQYKPTTRPTHPIQTKRPIRYSSLQAKQGQKWFWPVNGRVATQFLPQNGNKGIDIAGKKGEKIVAASSGIVAYAGSGLSGYGNLIIIKHNDQFLTAYGNNSHNRVKEGQQVKAGQIIADIGVVDRRYWGVHFEIRKAGKPVNPLDYLRRG